jgi:hypothetical protein
VIAFSDGQGNLRFDYNYSASGVWTIPASGLNMLVNAVSVPIFYGVYNASATNWFFAQSGNTSLTGYGNSGSGYLALSSITTGANNLAFGAQADRNLTTGSSNVSLGADAQYSLIDGSNNMAIGAGNQYWLAHGSNNIAIGYNCGTSGTGILSTCNNDIAIGNLCLQLSQNGYNIAIGGNVGVAVTTSSGNILMGNTAAAALATGGGSNVIIGPAAGHALVSGASNVFLGAYSAYVLGTSGSNNTFLGQNSGSNITGGSNSVILGSWQGPSGAVSGAIAFGDGAGNLRMDYNYTTASLWTAESDFQMLPQANGQITGIYSLTELTTIAAAATTTTTIQIPAGAVVLGVSVRVTTVIPTAATFTVTAGGKTFNTTTISTAVNTTDKGTAAGPSYFASATAITITPNLTPASNTGRVRTTIHFYAVTAPTS